MVSTASRSFSSDKDMANLVVEYRASVKEKEDVDVSFCWIWLAVSPKFLQLIFVKRCRFDSIQLIFVITPPILFLFEAL